MTGKSDRSYDWSVAFILLMVAVFTASFIPKSRIDWSIWRAARAIALLGPAQGPDRPDVLILSRQADDRFAVTSTLAPRGYVIHVVTTAEAALAELRQQPSRIGIVVVDEALPETRKVLLAARKFCPEACPILLKGQREPAQIARILMDSLDRHLTPEQARGLRQEAALKKGPASR
jgi:CheY-like chemotaxis protein